MTRIIIFIAIMFTVWDSGASQCDTWNKLSDEQKYRLQYSFTYGKQHDLGWTLAAIALVESSGGLYKINPDTQDYGLHQININNAMRIMNIGGEWNKRALMTKLVVDDEFNAYMAIQVLEGFRKQHNSDWRKLVMSYNTGNMWQRNKKSLQKGVDYYEKVRNNVSMLKRCSNFK